VSYKIWLSCLLLSIMLIGCNSPKIPTEQVEQMGIITARGTDLTNDKSIEATLVIFQFDVQSDSITKVLSGNGKTIKGAEDNANLESPFKLTSGKVQIELYGKETAEDGIMPYLDALQRDAAVNNSMYLAISNTTAKEVLLLNNENTTMNMGQLLYETINSSASEKMLPGVTLQDFMRKFYDVGIDNVLPVFDIEKNNRPKIKKIALFNAGQYVGDLTLQDNTLLNLINTSVKDQRLDFSIPISPFIDYLEKDEDKKKSEHVQVSIRIIKGKTKTKLIDKDRLKFESNITITARLQEQSSQIIFDNIKVTKLLEKELEKKMVEDLEALLETTQKLTADPFGYGKIYRTKQRDEKLQDEEWREKYPEIEVDFNVDLNIIRHGTTE